MPNHFYSQILKRAWSISWRNKFLWFFGFFAAFFSGGVYEIFFRESDFIVSGKIMQSWQNFWQFLQAFSPVKILQIFSTDPLAGLKVITVDLILLGLIILIVWLSISSLGALINAVKILAEKKSTSLKENFQAGHKNFWPIFLINILGKLLIFSFLLLMSLPALSKTGSGLSTLFYLLIFILAVLIIITVSFLIIYASAFIILKKQPFWRSIKKAWLLFSKNWLVSLEMALILFFISIGAGFALMFLLMLVSVPFVLILIICYYLSLNIIFWLFLILLFASIVAAIALANGLLTSFKISAWTLIFMQLSKKSFTGKLFQWLDGLLRRFSR